MNDNLKEYLDYIFRSFKGCRVGEGGFFPRAWNNDRNTTQSFKVHLFDVANVLIQNELIYPDDPSPRPFMKLAQRGYDYMQGGDLELGKLDLSQLIDLNKSGEEIYERLWLNIGRQDEAPFYLKGPEFYDTIAPFVGLTSYTYSQYTRKCVEEGRSASRISLFRELFMMLKPEQIEGFLAEISKTIIDIYQPLYREEPEEDAWLDDIDIEEVTNSLPVTAVAPDTVAAASSSPMVIFISYTWETKITPGHKEWVRKLAEKLVGEGFDVRFDQFQPLGTEMTHFMVNSVRDADRILLICTPEFKQCSDDMKKASGFEASLISSELIKDITTTRFIPIVRIGEPGEVMPAYLGNRNALVWQEGDDGEEKLGQLILELRRAEAQR